MGARVRSGVAMTPLITVLLRVAGVGLMSLAILHIPIAKHLKWREEAAQMSLASETVFHVHTAFICLGMLLLGLACAVAPQIFVVPSEGGAWLTWSLAVFWLLRLAAQWFVYPSSLWRGKRFETAMHVWFSCVWTALTTLFAVCGLLQLGRLA